MKKLISAVAALSLSLPFAATAMDHGSMGGMDHGSMGAAPSKGMPRMGKKIQEEKAEGYKLEYYLMDMAEMMKNMKMSMKDMDMSKMKSHHLMVYITSPDGKPIEDAKVGYLVAGPGGEQKSMAGAMNGGFGGDVDLKGKGSYKVTTKAVIGGKTLMDDFGYEVK
ncbi:MAG: hypothetical protein HY900_18495 [Deltaproteobacteria bacterium]|nr:hypothetical protein [Deltaproteobacteria bacterium]